MSHQVLLQMQSYSWLKTGQTLSLPLLPVFTFQTVPFPCNVSGGRGTNGPVLVLAAAGQGLGRRQECLTQRSRQAAFPQQLQQWLRGCLAEKCSH